MENNFYSKVIEIIRGSAKDFNIYFTYEQSGRPKSLAGATAIEVYLPIEGDPSVLTLNLTGGVAVVGVPELGHALVSLSGAQSLTLKKACVGQALSFSAKVVYPSGPEYFNFENALLVSDPKVKP